jgi:prefoldin subunit 5
MVGQLGNQLNDYKRNKKRIIVISAKAPDLVSRITKVGDACIEYKRERDQIRARLNQYDEARMFMKANDFTPANVIIEKVNDFQSDIKSLRGQSSRLATSIGGYKGALADIRLAMEEGKELKEQLPKQCPVCGKPLDDSFLVI